MNTASVEIGNLQQVLSWLLAVLLVLAALKELKGFASFLLLKLYEYFIQHS